LEEDPCQRIELKSKTQLGVSVCSLSSIAAKDTTMDEELLELQRQFEFAQQAKSSIRLSERNVVELVQKLHELQIIDFDLLHTVSGKEYITPVLFLV